MKLSQIFLFFALLPTYLLQAQVGIGTTTPNASLDIVSSNQATPANTDGLLIPRVDDFSASNPTAAQQGMMVYLTTASGANPPGYYYWNNTTTSWLALADQNDDWKLTGNTGTTPGTNFIGTTDNQDLVFKTNNTENLRLTTRGQLYMNNSGGSVFMGYQSGNNDDFSTNRNIGIGEQSLLDNTTGTGNVALGYRSLYNNINGAYNFAIGHQALFTNTSGNSNIAIGYASLYSNPAGFENIALGSQAMQLTTGGTRNIAIGTQALLRGTGSSNIAIGGVVLNGNTSGYSNIAIGLQSMTGNTTGYNNVALGYEALQNNTHGRHNTGLGYRALQSTTTRHGLVGVGAYALRYGTGNYNTAIGYEAQIGTFTTNNTGTYNTSIGYQTLYSNTTGGSNVANGFNSLNRNTTGNNNIANGFNALYSNTTGNDNTANGYSSLRNNTTGNLNTSTGHLSLYHNTTGLNNTANGNSSLHHNTTGNLNTATGSQSLNSNSTGSNNVANGRRSLYANLIGDRNIAIGYQAGYFSTGNANTYIGNDAGYNETGNNKLYIENTNADANSALIYGEFDTNILRINGELQLGITAANRYFLPTARGAASQILQTDGSGQLSFIDPATIGDGVGAEKINDLTDGKSDNDGSQNGSSVFLGVDAGAVDDSSDNRNVGVGFEALKANTTGGWNTANGYQSLFSNTTGTNNTANGKESLYTNITGIRNTANGNQSLYLNTGSFNVANGYQSLYANTTGGWNTANGNQSLYSNTTGSGNIANGYQSLYTNTTGVKNVALGYNAGYFETTSSNLYIENTDADADNALIYGDFGANNTTTGNILRVNGELQLGTTAANRYFLPTARGTASQILQTDGSGQLSFIDPAIIGDGDTQNTLDQAYNEGGAGAGRTITADNGAVEITKTNSSSGSALIANITSAVNGAQRSAIQATNVKGGLNTKLAYFDNSASSMYGLHFNNSQNLINIHGALYDIDVTNASGGNSYGSRVDMDHNGSSAFLYGYKSELAGTGTSTKYGFHTSMPISSNGIHYGVYADVQRISGYAGYFIGRMSLGNTTTNRYLMPASDGAANYIMQTNGSGQVSFVNPTTVGTDNQDLQLPTLSGTTLTLNIENGASTNIDLAPILDGDTQNTLDQAYNEGGAGAGRTITADNGAVEITKTNSSSGSAFIANITSAVNGAQRSAIQATNTKGGLNTKLAYSDNSATSFYGLHFNNSQNAINIHGALYDIDVLTASAGNSYGSRVDMDHNGSSAFLYGYKSELAGTGTSTKYGFHTSMPISSNGIHYGVYADVQRISGYAGYFIGRMSLGNTTTNRYLMPASDGAANYIMQTNGVGQVSFIDPATIGDGTGTDDQDLAGATLTGTSLQIDIENGSYTTVDLATLQDGTGTDDQQLNLSGTELTIEDGNMVNLATILDGTGTDDQDLQLPTLSGTTLTLNIEDGASTNIDLAPILDGTGTDNQDLLLPTLTGTTLNLNIEDGTGTSINLAPIQDGTGTDNQDLQLPTLSGTTLTLNIEDGASTNIDLAPILDGTGTDDQTISFAGTTLTIENGNTANLSSLLDNTDDQDLQLPTLSGTTLTLNIEDGASTNIDLAPILDGTGTDNQTIDTFSFDTGTNIITLEVEDDGIAAQTVNLSSINGDITNVIAGDGLTGGGTVGDVTLNVAATNGLIDTADTIKLGGALTENTAITQGTNKITFILNGTGDFNIQENAMTKFKVNNSGDTVLGGDLYVRDENAVGTILAKITDSGNDGILDIYKDGAITNRFRGDGVSYINGGNLGVGTTSPDEDLSVSGVVNLNEDLTAAGVALKVSGDEAIWYNDTRFSWGYGGTSNTFANDLGIGMTSAPSYRLDVRDSPAGDYVAQIYNTNTDANADGLRIRLGRTSPITSNNFIGFFDGSNNPRGEITGNASGVQYNTTSDRRLKTNIVNINDALELINNIQPRKYEFKTNLGIKEYGFIAQELQLFYPQAVSGSPNSNVETDPMMVDYSRLTPLLTAGIKELKEEVDTLKEVVDVLKVENKELKTKLSNYESLEARLVALENANSTREVLQISISENK